MRNSKVLITIAILNYNRKEFLDRSIRSCIEQILLGTQNIELIIIDDNSNDDSIEYIKYFEKMHHNIRVYINKKNMGIGYCSNLAVRKARGQYFIRVDSDDYLSKIACEMMSSLLAENKETDFVYCDHIRIDKKGLLEEKVRLDNKKKLLDHGAGIMFRRSSILEAGNYDKSLREAEDYDLVNRMIKLNYKSFYLPVPLYRYYIHGMNISLKGDRNKEIKKIKKNNGK